MRARVAVAWGLLLASCDPGHSPRCALDPSGACLEPCPTGEELYEARCVDRCQSDELRLDGVCRGPSQIRVNGVGYWPTQHKRAIVSDVSTETFRVRDTDDGQVWFEGALSGPRFNPDTEQELWTADFSALQREGRYTLEVSGLRPSAPFEIGAVYEPALRVALLGFYGLRCGTRVHFEHVGQSFEHAACHEDDGVASFELGSEHIDAHGGWHDAGDYGKYVANGAFSVGMLLRAWEDFEPGLARLTLPELGPQSSALPALLDEVRYELDWLMRMQRSDGAVHDKLTEANFGGFIMPEHDRATRALAPPSSEATAGFAAALAQGGRVFASFDAEYAQRCTQAAERAFEFLLAHPERLPFDAEAAGFHTGRYNSSDLDERLWAAAELWETTGDDVYLSWFESNASLDELPLSGRWDWPTTQNLAYFTYLASDRDGRSEPLLAELASAATQSADALVAEADAHGYGRAVGSHYIWGSNGILLRAVLNLHAAHRLAAEPRYYRAALQQLDHALGVNVYARSQVTGLGYLPPRSPHHRPSAADGVEPPWPGLLVGGANPAPTANDTTTDDPLPALSWQDAQGSYWSNEVAINWNAALVYALAWAHSEPPRAVRVTSSDAGTTGADASACCDAGLRSD